MKDRQALIWLYKNSKSQLLPMIILIFSKSLLAGCGILFALASRGLIDSAVMGNKSVLITHSLYLLGVILLLFFTRIITRSLEIRIQGRLELNYRRRLISQIIDRDYSHTAKYHSGELMNRLTGDVTVVTEGSASVLPELTALLTKLIGALSVLYVFSPVFTIVLTAGGLLLLTIKYFRGKLKHLHKDVQEKDGAMRSFMQETLESLIVIKTFGAERRTETKTAEYGQALYKARVRKGRISILTNSGFSLAFSLAYLYALVWGAFGLMAAAVSYGTLTAVLQLVGQVQAPFSGLSGLLPKIYSVIASAERLMELESLPEDAVRNKEDIPVTALYSAMRGIRLEAVSFMYDRELVINDAGLTIEKGDFAVVTGRSGIGKSTLIMLLLGIISPVSGTVGIELNTGQMVEVDKHTRKLFAYVPQNNLLLSGTIRENIAFSNAGASDKEIMSAADISCAADFIRALPRGLDTVIGEKGLGLSQGQIQRLAIARAVACGSPVLLLDEATSALDEATEERLLNNIRQMTDKTCVIVSHRNAAFELCNKEIRIENGSVITIKRKGSYVYETA